MKRFLIAGLAVMLTGCNWIFGSEAVFRDRANEYLKAEQAPRMTLPEGVPPNTDEQDYLSIKPLPEEVQKPLPEEFEIPVPPPLLADDKAADAVSLVDQTAFDGAKNAEVAAKLIQDETGGVALQFNKGFDETWDTVGESLKAAEIKIADLNRTQETYDIEYDDLPLQLSVKETAGVTLVTVLQDKKLAAMGLSQEVLQKIIDNLSR
jgi:outer membrane protein assembly factor BamC